MLKTSMVIEKTESRRQTPVLGAQDFAALQRLDF